MSEVKDIPSGWEYAELGEVCKLKNGYAFKSTDYLINDGIPVIRISDIGEGKVTLENCVKVHEKNEYENYVVYKDQILVAMSGATTGKFGIYRSEDKAYQNQRVGTFDILNMDVLNNTFLLYILYSLKGKILEDAYGGAQPNISSGKIEELHIPLPPLPEQHRIVAKIEELFSSLDKGIESLKTARQQLKVYRQAVLKWAFEGKLAGSQINQITQMSQIKENEIREIHKSVSIRDSDNGDDKDAIHKKNSDSLPHAPHINQKNHSSDNGELPEGWKWVKLGDVIDKIEAGKSFKCDERPPTKNETGILKVSSISWGNYNENESKTIYSHEKINFSYLVKKGDFLLSRANTLELVGAVVKVHFVSKNLLLSDKTLRIKYLNTMINDDYVLYFLRSSYGRKQIQLNSSGNQESMRNIGQEGIRKIKTPLPPTLEEQSLIVSEIESRLSVCDKIEESIEYSLNQAEALRQSILKKAFEGKLVPQDANDEPASVLLERIREERKAAVTTKTNDAKHKSLTVKKIKAKKEKV